MDYPTAQIWAASGFRLVRYSPDWLMDGAFTDMVSPQTWITKFVQSLTGGAYTPVIYVNGVGSPYTPTDAESAATDWSVVP